MVEVGVPALRLLPPGQTAVPFRVGPGTIAYDLYDVVTQATSSNYVEPAGEATRSGASRSATVWPSELDLMARLAGMRLVHRWGDWSKEPFTAESEQHVSVWRKE